MKILITAHTFPPYKDGISEAASVMAGGFLDRGWEVEVATSPADPPRSVMEWRGARIHEFAITGLGSGRHPYCGDVGNYQAFLEHGDWDVVIFHGHLWTLFVALKSLGKISGRKILVSHGFNALQWIRTRKFPWGLYVWFFTVCRAFQIFFWQKMFDRIVYLSDRTDFRAFFDHWIAKVLGHTGRRVIPNGVDANLKGKNASGFRRDFGIADDQLLFLYVANYSRRKDQGYALRAFRTARLSNAVMVFIGSEFNSDSAQFQAEDEALPMGQKAGRVVWLEKVDRDATLDAFAACDVFVLSAGHEAQPISLLEAMREARPWVARDVGCISEMPGGVCVRSEAGMSREMARLAANPSLRDTLGRQGRDSIEKVYNSKHYVDSYCDLVAEITQREEE